MIGWVTDFRALPITSSLSPRSGQPPELPWTTVTKVNRDNTLRNLTANKSCKQSRSQAGDTKVSKEENHNIRKPFPTKAVDKTTGYKVEDCKECKNQTCMRTTHYHRRPNEKTEDKKDTVPRDPLSGAERRIAEQQHGIELCTKHAYCSKCPNRRYHTKTKKTGSKAQNQNLALPAAVGSSQGFMNNFLKQSNNIFENLNHFDNYSSGEEEKDEVEQDIKIDSSTHTNAVATDSNDEKSAVVLFHQPADKKTKTKT